MTLPAKPAPAPGPIEAALMYGDIKPLSEEQRLEYYRVLCRSVGLNPLTKPFTFLWLNNKLVPYADKGCAEQLRKINNISIAITSTEETDGLFIAHAKARMPDGREDEDFGFATIGKSQGDARGNAILKAITKAKRRVTLSICGLGMLDETEIDDIADSAKREAKTISSGKIDYPTPKQQLTQQLVPSPPFTEQLKPPPPPNIEVVLPTPEQEVDANTDYVQDENENIWETLDTAASKGWLPLKEEFEKLSEEQQKHWRKPTEETFKPKARKVEQERMQ